MANKNLGGAKGPVANRAHRICASLGLPPVLKRWAATVRSSRGGGFYVTGKLRGARKYKALAARLPIIEAQLTLWEAENQEAYRALPWFEAREAFKLQKAAGTVVWPSWWELAGAAAQCGMIATKQK